MRLNANRYQALRLDGQRRRGVEAGAKAVAQVADSVAEKVGNP